MTRRRPRPAPAAAALSLSVHRSGPQRHATYRDIPLTFFLASTDTPVARQDVAACGCTATTTASEGFAHMANPDQAAPCRGPGLSAVTTRSRPKCKVRVCWIDRSSRLQGISGQSKARRGVPCHQSRTSVNRAFVISNCGRLAIDLFGGERTGCVQCSPFLTTDS